jgi:hypothetical protein
MSTYDLTPNAAEMYFNQSIFGQLHLLAEAIRRNRPAAAKPPRTPGRPEPVRRDAAAASLAVTKPTLLDRLDAWFWRQVQNDREAYLARSRDVFELERRIDALERGTITRYY